MLVIWSLVWLLVTVCLADDEVDVGWYAAKKRSLSDTNIAMREFQAGLAAVGEESVARFKKVVKHAPEVGDGHLNLGVAYERIGQPTKALNTYKRGLASKKCGSRCKAKVTKAACTLLLELHEYFDFEQARQEAFPLCQQSLEFERKHPTGDFLLVYSNMAVLYTQLQRFSDAKKIFKEILVQQPTYDRQTYLNYANACIRSGDVILAKQLIDSQLHDHDDDSYLVNRLAATIYTASEIASKKAIQFSKKGMRQYIQSELPHLKLVYEDDLYLSSDPDTELVYKADSCFGLQDGPFVVDKSAEVRGGHPSMQYPEKNIYIRSYKNNYIVGESGIIVSKKNVFSSDHLVSENIPEETMSLSGFEIVRHTEPEVASLLQVRTDNHYHWVVEVLCRAVIMENKYPGISYILNANNAVATASLTLLFGQSIVQRLLYLHDNSTLNTRYQKHYFPIIRRVLFALPHDELSSKQHVNDPWNVYFPPATALRSLRNELRGSLTLNSNTCDNDDDSDSYIVYISRSGDSARQVIDEPKLLEAIEKLLRDPSQRLRVFRPTIPFEDQLKLFSTAAMVISPHGAGIANMIVSEPGIPLVLFPMNPPTDSVWAHLSAALQFPYWLVPSINSFYYTSYHLSDTNIQQAADTISHVLREVGKGNWLA